MRLREIRLCMRLEIDGTEQILDGMPLGAAVQTGGVGHLGTFV